LFTGEFSLKQIKPFSRFDIHTYMQFLFSLVILKYFSQTTIRAPSPTCEKSLDNLLENTLPSSACCRRNADPMIFVTFCLLGTPLVRSHV